MSSLLILGTVFFRPFSFEICCAQVCARGFLSSPQNVQSPYRGNSPLFHVLRVGRIGPNAFPQCLPLRFVYSENVNVVFVQTL